MAALKKKAHQLSLRLGLGEHPASLRALGGVKKLDEDGQIDVSAAEKARRALRSILRAFGVVSRDVALGRSGRLRFIIDNRKSYAYHDWDGTVGASTEAHAQMSQLSSGGRLSVDAVLGLLTQFHEGLHDGGPVTPRAYDHWLVYGKVGVVIEDVSTEVLARSYAWRYLRKHGLQRFAHRPFFRISGNKGGAYQDWIDGAMAAFLDVGFARTEAGAAKLLLGVSERYKGQPGAMGSVGEAVRRWLDSVLDVLERRRKKGISDEERAMLRKLYRAAVLRVRRRSRSVPGVAQHSDAKPAIDGYLGGPGWVLSARDTEVLRLLIEMHECGELTAAVWVQSIMPGLESYPLAADNPGRVTHVLERRGIVRERPVDAGHKAVAEQLKPGILALNRRGLVTGYDEHFWCMYGLSEWMSKNGVEVHYKAGMMLY